MFRRGWQKLLVGLVGLVGFPSGGVIGLYSVVCGGVVLLVLLQEDLVHYS